MESSWDLYPMIWRIQKRRQRCRRRLLKSTPPAASTSIGFSLCIPLHLSPRWEGWSSGGLLAPACSCHCGADGGSFFEAKTEKLFQYIRVYKIFGFGFLVFWPGLCWFVWCCEVVRHVETDRSTSNPTRPLLKPRAMQVRKCCPPGIFSLILDLIPGLDSGARIRKRLWRTAQNMTGSSGTPKFLCRKMLSSLQNVWKLDGTIYPWPLPISTQKRPFKGLVSLRDRRVLVRFLFWTPKNKFSHPIWFMATCG